MGLLQLPSPVPTHDLVFIILHTIVDSVAIVENVVLLLAIILRSPSTLKSYGILLMYLALLDLLSSATSLMMMNRVIPAGEICAYVYDGPCVVASGFFCHILHSITVTSFSQSIVFVAVSFAYRLYVLVRPTPQRWQVLLLCFIITAPNVAAMTTFVFSLDDSDAVRNALKIARPEYALDDYVVEGHLSVYNWSVAAAILIITAPSTPILITVFMLRKKVLAKISEKSSQMSEKTVRLHRTLTKVLTIQALLPIIFGVGVVNYSFCQLDLMCSPVQEHLIMQAASVIPFISPAITL